MIADVESHQRTMAYPAAGTRSIGQDAGADRLRFVARFVNALLLARLTRWTGALGCDTADAFLVQSLLALTLPGTGPDATTLDVADTQRLPVPLAALAQATDRLVG